MKRVLFAFAICFGSVLACFSLPNIKLYENKELAYRIENDKIYDKNNELNYINHNGDLSYEKIDPFTKSLIKYFRKTISETATSILFKTYFDGKLVQYSEYDKKNGNLFLNKTNFDNKRVEEYDKKTGVLEKNFIF